MASNAVFLKENVGERSTPPRSARAGPLLEEVQKAHKRANILLVEDEQDLRETIRFFLVDKANVIEAVDGQKALDFILGQRNTVNLIITDIQMRGMEGPQFLAEIRKSGHHIPAIIMSGKVMLKEDYATINALGANIVFIPKPFDAETLLKEVNRLLVVAEQIFNESFERFVV